MKTLGEMMEDVQSYEEPKEPRETRHCIKCQGKLISSKIEGLTVGMICPFEDCLRFGLLTHIDKESLSKFREFVDQKIREGK